MTDFKMHPRLAAGGFHLAILNNCEVILKNNAHYTWFVIVPRVSAEKTEVTQLSEAEFSDINACTLIVSRFLDSEFSPDKINIGNIGNIVQQMHIHVIGRSEKDPAWPEVVWGHPEKTPYSDERVEEIKNTFKAFLAAKLNT
ncbi:MAG: diadenosine tetraphosphate (Ap4A) HIT family hydrolase [Cryomorphaceae bacterium]|jgi:diadenosine tetraphosphate (Ap4A) HIT family hydrolase